MHVATEPPDPLETAVFFLSLSPEDLRPPIVARWRRYLEQQARPESPVFGAWHDLMRLPDEGFAEAAARALERWRQAPRGTAEGEVNPLVIEALAAGPLTSRGDVARVYGDLLKRVYEQSKEPSGDGLQLRAAQQLLEILTGREGPVYFPKRNAYLYMDRVPRTQFDSLRQEIDKLAVASAEAPPRAMVLVDSEERLDPRVFVRGNPTQLGEAVPRRFPRILAGDGRQPFRDGSGRLDLARAIADPENPLTSRVMANRVWMHHFGEPLVATPSDFGTRSSPPSHPELLDWLAAEFIEGGWSIKAMHRVILLSSTYRQSSGFAGPLADSSSRVDPDNRLLWRARRRRLDFEQMRDTLLAVSGRLDRTLYGRPADVAADPANRRRTVYGLVDRQDLPGVFRAFDFASPDQSADRRPHTTVPQQALFAMNSPFVVEQARALAARDEVTRESSAEGRATALYRLVLARDPHPEEVAGAVGFVAGVEDSGELGAWEQCAQVLLMTNELLFVD